MAKIKGWKTGIVSKNRLTWHGETGDQVQIAKSNNNFFKGWYMGANGQLHVKQTKTKKEAIDYAMKYMKSHPNG